MISLQYPFSRVLYLLGAARCLQTAPVPRVANIFSHEKPPIPRLRYHAVAQVKINNVKADS
jgi:hypothetical protein